jgi:hypothetical protein
VASSFSDTPLPQWYVEFLVCREMSWTYRELDETPTDRVRQVVAALEIEERAANWGNPGE